MLVFKVSDIVGIPTRYNTYFDFQANKTTSGLININEFQKEEYVMELEEDDDDITIFINPKADGTSYDSKLTVPLAMIADGEKHEKYFDLNDMITENGEPATVVVQLQLVYSHVSLFKHFPEILRRVQK